MSLYRNVVMTFSQIARRHFANVKKPTVINRLTKLEAAGLVLRERIPRMELGLDKNAIGVVFQITSLGISELRRKTSAADLKAQPVRIHHHSLNHDLILVDLAEAFERRFSGYSVTNGKLLMATKENDLIPDLILQDPTTDEKTAIELELTGKSERRYREIVLKYRLSKQYQKVIYVLDDRYIKSLIVRTILNRAPHPAERPETGKFSFLSLTDFLKRT